ncbi:IS3 family transposase [Micromonospora okii]|uniref:IS3 family transposase n=1 Tax=Micromonospora okii TaxID=1182970 RepID=UPI001E51F85E|nr:IS3 family transposase [Micromonospora okii]
MRFIHEHRDQFAVALLLRVLNIGASTYYAWVKQAEQPCDRGVVDLGLISNIHEIWETSGRTYGADRVHRQLRRDGIRVGRKLPQPERIPDRLAQPDGTSRTTYRHPCASRQQVTTAPSKRGELTTD